MTTELLNTLYVQTQGTSLHLDHDSVRIVDPNTPGRKTLPLRRLDSIVVYGHVAISAELLARCSQDGRSVVWMSLSGQFQGRLDGPTRGNVLLRHAQHLAHADSEKRLTIARSFVAGKLQNSRQLLLRAARDMSGARQEELRAIAADGERLLEVARTAKGLDELLGCEGQAARQYFQGLGLALRSDLDIGGLGARTKRPPTDPINALLSFTYALLRTVVHGAAEQVGLDPYIGFLHSIRPAKPSLVLDLMEEFRPLHADRFVLNLLNRKQIRAEHFEHLPGGAVQLTEVGRKLVLVEWQRWKAREQAHPLLGRRAPTCLLPVIQSRLLARHIRGELPSYLPWTVR